LRAPSLKERFCGASAATARRRHFGAQAALLGGKATTFASAICRAGGRRQCDAILRQMPDDPPIGQRFSHVYIKRGEPAQDSARMRRRIAALVRTFLDLDDFDSVVPHELGIDVPSTVGSVDWPSFFRECSLQDVLDFVTLAYRHLDAKKRTGYMQHEPWYRWCREVQRIFEEENVHYRVDEKGGVHFRFDAEFEYNRAATIAALQGARYRNALNEFEGAMAALAKAPPDGKAAISGTFRAAEGLFRLMFEKSPRLTAQEAQQRLEPILQGTHAADKAAMGAASKLLNAFKDWIDAAHFYRHEPGQQDPVQPPLTLAVQMVSIGATFIRSLAELDATQTR
jgi:hypothetical protein